MCCVPKTQLDSLEPAFAARTKKGMQKAMEDAWFEGIFPGWEREPEQQKRPYPIPKPIAKADGTVVQGRLDTATTRIGRNFLFTFFDDLDGVDLHQHVRFDICVQDMFYMFVLDMFECADCVLLVCCLCAECVYVLTVCCTQAGLDPMHTVDLGIWVHLLTAIAYKYESTLKSPNILSQVTIDAVWKRLEERAQAIKQEDSMLKVTPYRARYMKFLLDNRRKASKGKKDKKGRSLESWEHQIVMLVMFFLQ